MDELNKKQQTAAAGTGTANQEAGTSQRVEELNRMYDAQLESQKNQLQGAYEQSRSAAQAARDKLPEQYQQQANDLAVQYERNRRNFNQQAAGNGINTGTGSQAALAQNSAWQRDYGNLRTAEAQDMAEADRGLADLEAEYQRQIAGAMAQNDYERSAALLQEYENAYQRQMQEDQIAYQRQQDALEQEYRRQTDEYNRQFQQDQWAYQKEQDALDRQYQQGQTDYQRQQNDYARQLDEAAQRAQWGDFSGYAALYGQEQADNMRQLWLFQNPEMAYTMGGITAEQYRSLTGKEPAGAAATGSGGSYSAGGGGGSSTQNKTAQERYQETAGRETDQETYGPGIDPRAMSALTTPVYNARSLEELEKYYKELTRTSKYYDQNGSSNETVVDRMNKEQRDAVEKSYQSALERLTGGR